MNTKILEELGLTAGEIKAYLALLKIGSSSTGPLANESGVSRSKLYSILDKLEKKGLVGHVEQNGVICFQAVEPAKIKDYINQKKEALELLDKDFELFLPQLKAFKESMPQQQVTLYRGFKGLKTAYEHIYLKLKRGDEYYALGVPAYQPEEHHAYWRKDHLRRAKAGIKARMLFNQGTAQEIIDNRNSYPLCAAKLMPTTVQTPAWINVYKDTVMIAIARKETIAIEIVNQDVADSFLEYFESFWNQHVMVYIGMAGAARVIDEIIEAGKKGLPNYGFGTHDNPYDKYLHKDLERFWAAEKKYKFKTQVIFMKGGEHHQPYAETRYLPREFLSPVRIMIYGDKVAMVDFTEPITTTIIDKKEIADAYKNHFKLLWKIAKP